MSPIHAVAEARRLGNHFCTRLTGGNRSLITSAAILATLAALLLAGCGKHGDSDGHDHDKGKAGGKGDSHSHGEEAPGGASFKPGTGVILTDETRQSIGVETAEVTERKLLVELRFTAQVFGENHKPTAAETEHAECTARASGLLSQAKAAALRAGQPVGLVSKSGETLGGMVLAVNKSLAIGDAEVVVGITNAGAKLKPAEFLSATIALPRDKAATVVPRSAVLRAADGTFVYTINGNAYFRTAVKTGAEAEGFVEITEGLLEGDAVVTTPVERLWLIELRATKGGGHSH